VKYPHGWDQIARFYGWSMFRGDVKEWEARMTLVRAPAGVSFYFDRDGDGQRDPDENARGIRVHPAVAVDLEQILTEIRDAGLWRYVEPMSGGFAWRTQRGSTKLSTHSLGIGIDFDAIRNPLGVPPSKTAIGTGGGLKVVSIFEAHGWTWGGNWHRPDAMHFQACSGY
jgi:hypothetical protein